MTYALDSNIISYWLNNRYNLEKRLEKEFDHENTVVIPPITYYEIIRGLYAVNSRNKLAFFESLCVRLAQGDMAKADWVRTAKLYVQCRRNGQTMAESDLLQAGFCLQHGYILVTHNSRHFDHIPDLSLEDWVQ